MYRRILVPTDGSEVAEKAFEHALDIAKRYDATLHLVHVIDADHIPSGVSSVNVLEELEGLGDDIVARVVERAEDAGVDVEGSVIDGHHHDAILQYADEHDVDLIVIGTHGRRGVESHLLGSVTERIVRAAEMPVLTVHPPSDEDDVEEENDGETEASDPE